MRGRWIELIKGEVGIVIEIGRRSEPRSGRICHENLEAIWSGTRERSGEKRFPVARCSRV